MMSFPGMPEQVQNEVERLGELGVQQYEEEKKSQDKDTSTSMPPNQGQGTSTSMPPNQGQGTSTSMPPNQGKGTSTSMPPNQGQGTSTSMPPNQGQGTSTSMPPVVKTYKLPTLTPITKSNNGNFDLGAVFNIQKNYITDLSNSYPNVNNAPEIVGYVADLQGQMAKLAKQYHDANTSSTAVLDQQTQMINIVDAEQQRLNAKKALIDQAEFQESREVLLNNTYRQKYGEYTKIVIVIVISLLIFVLIRYLTTIFASVPSGLVVLLHIGNVVGALIIITYIYAKLYSRDSINFDEIRLPPPITNSTNAPTSTTSTQKTNQKSLFSDFCLGDSCCADGTIWDPIQGKCIVAPVDNFSTLNTAYTCESKILSSYNSTPNVYKTSDFGVNSPYLPQDKYI
jgi:F0F1-type ATP synthase assembly protein I